MMYIENHWLGGGFKDFSIFIPIWGRFPFWRAYFSKGLKPPTSWACMSSDVYFNEWHLFSFYGTSGECWNILYYVHLVEQLYTSPSQIKVSLKSDSSFRVSKMTFPKGHWTPHEADCLDPRRIFIQAPFIFLLLEHVLSINPTPKTTTKILHTCLLCFPTYVYIYIQYVYI